MDIKNEPHEIENFEDEIDLVQIFKVLFEGKWIIFSVTTVASILAVIYSLSLPNIYESKILLVPNEANSRPSLLQNYSSLANIAGVSLPSENNEGNSFKAIRKLNSLSFFESNILPNIFLPDLMAFDSWNSGKNINNYKNDIYDLSSNSWVRDYSYPQKQIPSAQESFDKFQAEHVSISEEKKNNFVTIKVKHQSPYVAKEWAELLTNQINYFYREKDREEAEKAVNYLNTQIAKTNLSEIKQVIAALLQQETQKLTLIEANEFYVYEFIDPPAVMETKSEPSRAIICILGAILGGILSILTVMLRHYVFVSKD